MKYFFGKHVKNLMLFLIYFFEGLFYVKSSFGNLTKKFPSKISSFC